MPCQILYLAFITSKPAPWPLKECGVRVTPFVSELPILYINSVYIRILFFCYVSCRNFAIIPWCKSLLWNHGVGDFSSERTNLLSLHQLHRRTLRFIKGSVRANLWSGIIELECKSFWIHLFAHYACFYASQISITFFGHSSEQLVFWWLDDTSLFFIYVQMLVILTKSINRCFEKNPKFDMTPLLGGTEIVFSSLIHSFSWFVFLFLACSVFQFFYSVFL